MSDENKRREDLELSLFGLKMKGSVKAIASFITSTAGMLALIGVLLYHDYKDDQFKSEFVSAAWFQVLMLATEQENRVKLLKQNSIKLPESVRNKLGEDNAAQRVR